MQFSPMLHTVCDSFTLRQLYQVQDTTAIPILYVVWLIDSHKASKQAELALDSDGHSLEPNPGCSVAFLQNEGMV
jgi:hypothetical protein